MTAPRPRRAREEWPEALSSERKVGLGVGSRRGPSRIMEKWYEAMDVVIVPFPFTDGPSAKRRPALVLSRAASFGGPSGHSVMAMITSARNPPWPLDASISELDEAGLPAPSVVRMKLFTLDHRFVLRTAGQLSEADAAGVRDSLRSLIDIA